jgi:hypothetical protein
MFLAHAISMQQPTFENVSHNFHVAVRVRAKASSGRDEIVIQYAECSEIHVRGIAITGKRE